MTLEKYGVILHRLTHDKIEMVRNWRNDPKILKYMEFREYITPEMQEKWFQKINNDNNFFFIIEYEGKEIGLVNGKNIDYEQKTSEGGLFIYDDDYLNSDVPFRVSLCSSDFGFETLNLEKVFIHILSDNKRAIKYNLMLGFELQPNQENIRNQLYFQTKENYFKKRALIKRLLN
ncbi:MAG: GNAT family N-acetyltransferase [Candidatus Azobacteroides sp.]|nr:GNAT family N-acetyltransferase [Candidatus Azobacteroides sp.]